MLRGRLKKVACRLFPALGIGRMCTYLSAPVSPARQTQMLSAVWLQSAGLNHETKSMNRKTVPSSVRVAIARAELRYLVRVSKFAAAAATAAAAPAAAAAAPAAASADDYDFHDDDDVTKTTMTTSMLSLTMMRMGMGVRLRISMRMVTMVQWS